VKSAKPVSGYPHWPPAYRPSTSSGRLVQWDERLTQLRQQAVSDSSNAVKLTQDSALLILLACSFIIWCVMYFGIEQRGIIINEHVANGISMDWTDWWDCYSFLIVPLILLPLGLYCLELLISTRSSFHRHYNRSWYKLQLLDQARLYTDDGLHAILRQRLSGLKISGINSTLKNVDFSTHLNYCACHAGSLERLAQNPSARLSWWQMQAGQNVCSAQGFFKNRTALLEWHYGCHLMHGIAWIGLLGLLTYCVVVGPGFVASRGRLVAFIDFMLRHKGKA
jgi:hypothetical protein